jgi:hypothetical protein
MTVGPFVMAGEVGLAQSPRHILLRDPRGAVAESGGTAVRPLQNWYRRPNCITPGCESELVYFPNVALLPISRLAV